MAPITHDVQTLQQHVEQPTIHKTQSSTTIDNIRNKGTKNSVADVLSHASPHPYRSTDVRPEDVTPLHVLSDSIPANHPCLDSVQTKARKDGTLQQPQNCQATQSTRCSQLQEGLSQYASRTLEAPRDRLLQMESAEVPADSRLLFTFPYYQISQHNERDTPCHSFEDNLLRIWTP